MRGFLLKFVERKYIDDMVKGNYFFKNISYFKTLEENEKLGIKDPKEGTYQRELAVKNHIVKLGIDGELFDIPINKATLSYEYEDIKNVAIMSLMYLPMTDFIIDPEKEEWLKIKPEVVEEIGSEFSDRPFFMIPCGNFFEQIEEHNFKNDNVLMHKTGLVNYYKTENYEKDPDNMTREDIYDLCFQKHEFFSKQREYRVALVMDAETSDCSIQFKNKSEFITRCESYKQLNNFRIVGRNI